MLDLEPLKKQLDICLIHALPFSHHSCHLSIVNTQAVSPVGICQQSKEGSVVCQPRNKAYSRWREVVRAASGEWNCDVPLEPMGGMESGKLNRPSCMPFFNFDPVPVVG